MLRQILEQSMEFNSTIFIDFEKAFDSLHRESLWRILRHYGIPQKMIKILYTNVQCQVACNSHMSDCFSVKSGVKQGCILSPFLFTLAIDWLMTEITKEGNRGIRWTLTSILDYADDIGLLSSRHKDMQEKMDKLTTTAPQVRLKLNTAKTKLMKNNYKTDNPITINNSNVWKRFRTLHIWEAKSQQMETLQKMPWLERQARPSLCWSPSGNPSNWDWKQDCTIVMFSVYISSAPSAGNWQPS